MQGVLYAALSIAVLVIAGAVAVLVSGVLREARKIGQTCEDLSSLMKTTEEELARTTEQTRIAMADVDRLVVEVTDAVKHVDNAANGIERIVETVESATSALHLVKSSTGGLVSVYEGVKQGIRALWGAHETDKEGTVQ
jgi:uncharacterized protein YoxC